MLGTIDKPRVIDMRGSVPRRDDTGRFIRVAQIAYTTQTESGEVVRFLRRFDRESIRGAVGRSVARRADRGKLWALEVLNSDGDDITQDFAVFARLA